MAWSWPGNVRDLRQRIGALTAAHAGGVVRAEDLPPELREPQGGAGEAPGQAPPAERVLRPLAEVEQEHIRAVLRALGADRRRAADVLGIHRKTLARRLTEGQAPAAG